MLTSWRCHSERSEESAPPGYGFLVASLLGMTSRLIAAPTRPAATIRQHKEEGSLAMGIEVLIVLIVIVLFIIIPSLRICSEWERKVVLRLGRFGGVRGPGVFLLLPWIERTPFTVDLRTVTSSFTAEQTLTKDNVPVNVDTILFWRVIDPARAVLQVMDYTAAVMGAAQTALRDIIGQNDLNRVLSERAALDLAMTEVLDAQTEPWGIKVSSVQMRDI